MVAAKFHSCSAALSDKNMESVLKPLILKCAELNDITPAKDYLSFIELDWSIFDRAAVDVIAKKVEFVLASDCLYDEREYDNFFMLMRSLKDSNPALKILAVYEDRGAFDCLYEYAACYQFKINDEINTGFWKRLDTVGVADKFNRNCYLLELR